VRAGLSCPGRYTPDLAARRSSRPAGGWIAGPAGVVNPRRLDRAIANGCGALSRPADTGTPRAYSGHHEGLPRSYNAGDDLSNVLSPDRHGTRSRKSTRSPPRFGRRAPPALTAYEYKGLLRCRRGFIQGRVARANHLPADHFDARGDPKGTDHRGRTAPTSPVSHAIGHTKMRGALRFAHRAAWTGVAAVLDAPWG